MQSRQKQGLVNSSKDRQGGESAPFSPPAQSSAPGQAETEKLGVRGASLMGQVVARDMAVADRPGQIMT